MKALTTSLLFIYSLSIMGYALLDGTHELLHRVKNPFHQHEVKTRTHVHGHSHHHHHVEDHHKVDKTQTVDAQAPSASIDYYFLFFHVGQAFATPLLVKGLFLTVFGVKLPMIFLTPHTPPPLFRRASL